MPAKPKRAAKNESTDPKEAEAGDAELEEMDADELELLYWGSAFEVMLPKHAQS